MGMFDWINFKCKCPNCGEEVMDFQSKDNDCTLARLNPTAVNNFYSNCDNLECDTWIEFDRVPIDVEPHMLARMTLSPPGQRRKSPRHQIVCIHADGRLETLDV